MAAARMHASERLRRAGLIAAVLALVAGILAMHGMNAAHASHAPAKAAAADGIFHEMPPAGHAGQHASRPSDATDMPGTQEAGVLAVPCTDSGHCTSMASMTAACTPSANTGTLAAPPPGTAVIDRESGPGTRTVSVRWHYRPGSPSPGDLCISRT